jgi:hypothetical protein
MDFKALRTNAAKDAERLRQKIADQNNKKFTGDDRYWKPTTDKAGNASAVIRFLPAPGDESSPWVSIYRHHFKHPDTNLTYSENCLTTIGGKEDPVVMYSSWLWSTGTEENKAFVSQLTKRRLGYISNIYVVKDPGNPENEGKVFLFKYGTKIYEKITSALTPEFQDQEIRNPFDLWEGLNFRLRVRQVAGYANYDKSEFDSFPTALSEDNDELERIWKSEHSLEALVAPDQFKPFDVLKARLEKVIGVKLDERCAPVTANSDSSPPKKKDTPQKPTKAKQTVLEDQDDTVSDDERDDDTMSLLKRLAQEDDGD